MHVWDGDLRMQIIQVAAPVAVDTSGIGNWLRDNAVKILLIVIGLVVLMASGGVTIPGSCPRSGCR